MTQPALTPPHPSTMSFDSYDGCSPEYVGKVYVGGIGEDVTRGQLESEYGEFGDIKDIWVARNPAGFAFVQFYEEKDGTCFAVVLLVTSSLTQEVKMVLDKIP